MKPDDNKALIYRPGTAISPAGGRRTSRVIARVTQDVLTRARSAQRKLTQARFRIGEYELREPDYRQILDWAEHVGMEPEDMLALLGGSVWEDYYEEFEPIRFQVADGAIRSLVWDLDELGLLPSKWRDGLLIETLALAGTWPDKTIALVPQLPSLKRFFCLEIDLEILDLSLVSGLTELDCGGNQLTALDLSPVPALTRLDCGYNQLTELDLSPVPGLTELYCGDNQLTELDLSPVSGLTELYCWNNQHTELDLSPVPGLTELSCGGNQLTELDLSPVPGLTKLYCWKNQLTELDLSPVPGLAWLNCDKSLHVINPSPSLKILRYC